MKMGSRVRWPCVASLDRNYKGTDDVHSCIYQGSVRHRRFSPVAHTFSYPLFLMYLDLDELPSLFAGRCLWSADRFALAEFRRTDHLGDLHLPLGQAVRDLVEQRSGQRPQGSIRLLTHLRYFGYCFNPVSFYFCYDPAGQTVQTIVAEVNNTPWGEQHCYILDESNAVAPRSQNRKKHNKKHYSVQKVFHVSPFMHMDVEYDWQLTDPDKQLTIHIVNRQAGQTFFDVTLQLSRQEISSVALARVLCRYPAMTLQVIVAIYFQALRLKWKRIPIYAHPLGTPADTPVPIESSTP